MSRCKECDKEFDVGVKGYCSLECAKINFQKRIEKATKEDKSHTNELSHDD